MNQLKEKILQPILKFMLIIACTNLINWEDALYLHPNQTAETVELIYVHEGKHREKPHRGALKKKGFIPEKVKVIIKGGTTLKLTDAILVALNEGSDIGKITLSLGKDILKEIKKLPGPEGHYRIRVRKSVDPVVVSELIRKLDSVKWSHPDFIVPLYPSAFFPDDTFFHTLWHLHNTAHYSGQVEDADIDAPEAWETATGKGIVIAVMDTGVDIYHEDLNCVEGYDFVEHDSDPYPDISTPHYEHGTAVAGVAGAIGNNSKGVAGAAIDALIMPIRLLSDETTLGDIYNAFIWATDHGADVINNSWTFSAERCNYVPGWGAIWDGIEYATEEGREGKGTIVLFGAGNGGCNINDDMILAHPYVIVVGASYDTDTICDYSNYGDYISVVAPSGPHGGAEHQYIRTTDIMGSPGYNGWMGNDSYTDTFWGTSASTPIVAGVVALIMEANSRLNYSEIRTVLEQTADKIDFENGSYNEEGHSPYYGYGRVNAYRAVSAIYNRPPSVPEAIEPVGETIYRNQPTKFDFRAEDPDGDELTYNLWIYNSEGSDEVIHWFENVTPPVEVDLQPAENYSWEVVAVDLYGQGEKSERIYFSILLPQLEEENIEEVAEPVEIIVEQQQPEKADHESGTSTEAENPEGGCGCWMAP